MHFTACLRNAFLSERDNAVGHLSVGSKTEFDKPLIL